MPLVTNHFYHVFNRGVARQPTFLNTKDYEQAILAVSYYRFIDPPTRLSFLKDLPSTIQTDLNNTLERKGKYVDIIAYVLMPNHFHFLLKQNVDGGITKFMSQFSNSYSRYFNVKHNRVGPVFQGRFKSILIESDEQLTHLSRYIHLNPVASAVIHENELLSYPWSSLKEYREGFRIINSQPVLEHFKDANDYIGFVKDNIDYARKLEIVKHLVLEET